MLAMGGTIAGMDARWVSTPGEKVPDGCFRSLSCWYIGFCSKFTSDASSTLNPVR